MIEPILLSLKIATLATILIFCISIVLLKLLMKTNYTIKNIIETILTLPLVLPPSVVGYGLLIIFSRNSFIGKFIYNIFNTQIIFSIPGGIIAASVVAFPLMYQSIKNTILTIDNYCIEAARTMGASELQIFLKITLPLAWPGILSGFILSFARCIGEFGATLMVMGNIPGKTQTIPTAIYFAVEKGDNHTANLLVLFITLLSFSLTLILNFYLKKKLDQS